MINKINEEVVFKNDDFSLLKVDFEKNDGKKIEKAYIDYPLSVGIVPFIDDKNILFVREYRFTLDKEFLTFPGGKLDKGESLYNGAKRELIEETGYSAGKLIQKETIFPCVGYSNEKFTIFEAYELKKVEQKLDDDELIKIEVHPISSVKNLIEKHIICDACTIAVLSLLKIK